MSKKKDLATVKEYGLALQHVNEQTLEICLAAVKEDEEALPYVNKTVLEKMKKAELIELILNI